jgi:hypothetical protein
LQAHAGQDHGGSLDRECSDEDRDFLRTCRSSSHKERLPGSSPPAELSGRGKSLVGLSLVSRLAPNDDLERVGLGSRVPGTRNCERGLLVSDRVFIANGLLTLVLTRKGLDGGDA